MVWFAAVSAIMDMRLQDQEADGLCLDLMGQIPREQVIRFQTTLPIIRSEELCVEMCNLTHLHLVGVDLSTWPGEPDGGGSHTFKGPLRSLRHIVITRSTLSSGDWGPFTRFLSRRAAVGTWISSLLLNGHPDMGGDVAGSSSVWSRVKCVAKVFEDDGSGKESVPAGNTSRWSDFFGHDFWAWQRKKYKAGGRRKGWAVANVTQRARI